MDRRGALSLAPRALSLAFPARLRRVRKRLSLSQNNLGEGRGALRAGYFECGTGPVRGPSP
jgi:hypothetical protein